MEIKVLGSGCSKCRATIGIIERAAHDLGVVVDIVKIEDHEEIRRSGADNIPDILQFVAGLNVRRYGFAAADVGVRGYNETSNPRLLVLLNGLSEKMGRSYSRI